MKAGRVRLGVAVLAAALVLTACTPDSAAETPLPSAPTPVDTATPTPETTAPAAGATCETLISPSVVDSLTAIGFTAQEESFVLGEMDLGGLWCKWGDYSAPANDNVQIYGWAPIDAEQAAVAQDALVSQGWLREDAEEGVYVGEDPQFGRDPDSQDGMTYLFGDGWVIFADYRQDLVLIDIPE